MQCDSSVIVAGEAESAVLCVLCRCSSDFVRIQLLLKKFSNSTTVIHSGLVPLLSVDPIIIRSLDGVY